MMYFAGWAVLVALSLWISLVAFIWAYQTGQFKDQTRARYLPLRDELPAGAVRDPAKRSLEAYALLVVLVIGLIAMFTALVLSLLRLKG
jgi:cbb3-type cytochrome oxidase maturation protein